MDSEEVSERGKVGSRREEVVAVCAFCWSRGVYRHHWFEGVDRVRHEVDVCPRCNCILKRPKGDPERYLLPSLNIQKLYVREVTAGRRPAQTLAELADDMLVVSDGETKMVRLPVEVAKRVEGNASRLGVGVSEYLRRLVVRQVARKR